MTKVRTTTILALAAGALLVASPAFAWTCTAKNARGVNYSGFAIIKAKAGAIALARCKANSAAPLTCHIVSCTVP